VPSACTCEGQGNAGTGVCSVAPDQFEKTKPIYPKRGRTEVSEAGCDSRQHELIGRMKPKFLNFAAKIV
jgi:hypothetical protein